MRLTPVPRCAGMSLEEVAARLTDLVMAARGTWASMEGDPRRPATSDTDLSEVDGRVGLDPVNSGLGSQATKAAQDVVLASDERRSGRADTTSELRLGRQTIRGRLDQVVRQVKVLEKVELGLHLQRV